VRIGDPSASWDLAATFGPFVVARLTTAVAWRWEPRHAVAYRPRPAAWLGGAVAIGIGLAGSWIGWAALAVVPVGIALDALSLRSRVNAALARTTAGARP
jgi:hypothetical protein